MNNISEIDKTAERTKNSSSCSEKLTYSGMKKQKQVRFHEPDSAFINEAKQAQFGKLRIVMNDNNQLQFRVIGQEKETDQYGELKTEINKKKTHRPSIKNTSEKAKQHSQTDKASTTSPKKSKAGKRRSVFTNKELIGFHASEEASHLSSEFDISNELVTAKKVFGQFDFMEREDDVNESITNILAGLNAEPIGEDEEEKVEMSIIELVEEPRPQVKAQQEEHRIHQRIQPELINDYEVPVVTEVNAGHFATLNAQHQKVDSSFDEADWTDDGLDCGEDDVAGLDNLGCLQPCYGINALPEKSEQKIQDFKRHFYEGRSMNIDESEKRSFDYAQLSKSHDIKL